MKPKYAYVPLEDKQKIRKDDYYPSTNFLILNNPPLRICAQKDTYIQFFRRIDLNKLKGK